MNKERSYGIDLLRIVLMLFVILGHLYAHTDLRKTLPLYSSSWIITWFFQSITICAVDCFILLSGYCGYSSNPKSYKIVCLWGKVLFYSVCIPVVLFSIGRLSVSSSIVLDGVFPILRSKYWFITDYIVLSLFRPFLNEIIKTLANNKKKILLVLLVVTMYIEPLLSIVFFQIDPQEGMSVIGFISLYLIGGLSATLNFEIKRKWNFVFLLISVSVMFISKLLLSYVVNSHNLNFGTALLYHYNSIFVLLNALLLLLLFKNIQPKGFLLMFVRKFSPYVFGVYLIHEEPSIRRILWNSNLATLLQSQNALLYLLLTIGIAFAVLGGCLFLDYFISKLVLSKIVPKRIQQFFMTVCNKFDSLLYSSPEVRDF